MAIRRIFLQLYNLFVALRAWYRIAENRILPVSSRISSFLSAQTNSGIFAVTTGSASFFCLVFFFFKEIGWKFAVASVVFCVYMHALQNFIWWKRYIPEAASNPNLLVLENLHTFGKSVLESFVSRFIIYVGDLSAGKDQKASLLLLFGLVFLLFHLIFISKFFFLAQDFGFGDGVLTIIFIVFNHLLKSPWEQFFNLIITTIFLVGYHKLYSTCCEYKMEEKQREREELEKKAKEEEAERKQKEAAEAEKKKHQEEDEAEKKKQQEKEKDDALIRNKKKDRATENKQHEDVYLDFDDEDTVNEQHEEVDDEAREKKQKEDDQERKRQEEAEKKQKEDAQERKRQEEAEKKQKEDAQERKRQEDSEERKRQEEAEKKQKEDSEERKRQEEAEKKKQQAADSVSKTGTSLGR